VQCHQDCFQCSPVGPHALIEHSCTGPTGWLARWCIGYSQVKCRVRCHQDCCLSLSVRGLLHASCSDAVLHSNIGTQRGLGNLHRASPAAAGGQHNMDKTHYVGHQTHHMITTAAAAAAGPVCASSVDMPGAFVGKKQAGLQHRQPRASASQHSQ
jgi:hypothetical protein